MRARLLWLAALPLLAAPGPSARADDPAAHARSCSCGTACRGKTCCCGKPAASGVKAVATPTSAAPSPCLSADPCGDRGDLPMPAPTPPWARASGLAAVGAVCRDVAEGGLDVPGDSPLPLDPIGRRPDEPPEVG